MEQDSPFHGTSFAPIATSSSLDEQVLMKEQFCTDTIKFATHKTETASTNDGNKKEKMTLFVCSLNCDNEQRTLPSLKYHIQFQHSDTSPAGEISGSDENTMRPFECGVEPFKTKK